MLCSKLLQAHMNWIISRGLMSRFLQSHVHGTHFFSQEDITINLYPSCVFSLQFLRGPDFREISSSKHRPKQNRCLPMESVEGFSHMVPGHLVFGNVPQWTPTAPLLSTSGEVETRIKKRYRGHTTKDPC